MNLSIKCHLCDKWSRVVEDHKYCPFCGKEYIFNINSTINRMKDCIDKRAAQFKRSILVLFGTWIGSNLFFTLVGFNNGFILFVFSMLLGCFVCLLWMWKIEEKEKSDFADLYSNSSLKIN